MNDRLTRRGFMQGAAAVAAGGLLASNAPLAQAAAGEGNAMKTSMNVLLWTADLMPENYPLLAKLKNLGYEGVELPMFPKAKCDFAAAGKQIRQLGLGSSAVTVMSPDANPVSPDPAIRKAAVEHLRWAIGNVNAMGGDVLCGPMHSALGEFTGEGPTAEERKRIADVLAAVADEARAANVKLSVEFLCRFECYALTTARDAASLCKEINHPNIGMLYDTFHANIEEKDPVKSLDEVMPYVNHVHISENDRGTPGRGHVDWEGTFAVLRKHNYKGWLTIEAFGRAMPVIAAATRVWRDFFPSPDQVCEEGLKLMQRLRKA